jgi:hypothetical protein
MWRVTRSKVAWVAADRNAERHAPTTADQHAESVVVVDRDERGRAVCRQ